MMMSCGARNHSYRYRSMARDTDTDTAAETDADTAADTDTATDSVSVMALTLTTAGLDNDDVASLLQLVGNSAPRLQRSGSHNSSGSNSSSHL